MNTGLETFFTVSQETRLFLLSCLFGVPLGILYDCFRCIRILFRHGKILVAIEDLFVMFIYAAFVCTFAIVFARGEFRFYYILGNSIGFTLYFFTLGSLAVSCFRKISVKFKGLIIKSMAPFRTAFIAIHKNLNKFLAVFYRNSKKKHKSSK